MAATLVPLHQGGCPFFIQNGTSGDVPTFTGALGYARHIINNVTSAHTARVGMDEPLGSVLERTLGAGIKLGMQLETLDKEFVMKSLQMDSSEVIETHLECADTDSMLLKLTIMNTPSACVMWWPGCGEALSIVNQPNGYVITNPRTTMCAIEPSSIALTDTCARVQGAYNGTTLCNILYLKPSDSKGKEELEPDMPLDLIDFSNDFPPDYVHPLTGLEEFDDPNAIMTTRQEWFDTIRETGAPPTQSTLPPSLPVGKDGDTKEAIVATPQSPQSPPPKKKAAPKKRAASKKKADAPAKKPVKRKRAASTASKKAVATKKAAEPKKKATKRKTSAKTK